MTNRGRTSLIVALAVLVGSSLACTGEEATVSGTIYADTNSNGRRDAGEAGVPGVVISRYGTARDVTDANGAYDLPLPAGTHTLTMITGWLASGCPGDLYCAAGRGPDQSFESRNQRYLATVSLAPGQTVSGFDSGLLPDRGDPTGAPGSQHDGNDAGDGPATAVDIAVRHSWVGSDDCADPEGTRVCSLGDQFTTNVQVFNQGTTAVAGIAFVVTFPRGARLRAAPAPSAATPRFTITAGRSGTFANGEGWREYRLEDPLPAAAAAFYSASWEIVGGPPSPTPYGVGRDRDRHSFVKISALAGADRDSTPGVYPFGDRDGGHNVNWPVSEDEDASDTSDWNTDAG